MTGRQASQVKQLKRAIDRMDRAGRGGRRRFKVWDVVELANGSVRVESVVGWPSHPFDDIERVVTVGPRGGMKGWGNRGHGEAGEVSGRGPEMLYRMNAKRVF